MLSSFLERYGGRFSNGPIPVSPTNRIHPTGSETASLASFQTGYSPRGHGFQASWSAIRPPPYESPTQATFVDANNALLIKPLPGRSSGPLSATGHEWTWDNTGTAIPRDLGQVPINQEPSSTHRQNDIEGPFESVGLIYQEQGQVSPKQKNQASLRESLQS